MKKISLSAVVFIFSVLLANSFLFADDTPKSKFSYSGVYKALAQSQHAFRFDDKTYDDNYVNQMFRLNLGFAPNEFMTAITRLDLAQGWWGVDNALRSVQRTGTGGGSALFDFKDTNFLLHVDQAYVEFNFPNSPVTARVGRMWYGLGNKIMVDNNYDGIQIDLKDVVGKKLTFSWARVSEGVDGLSDIEPEGDGPVAADPRDADLLTLNFHNKTGGLSYDVYGMYYIDRSTRDMTAYVPDMLQFFRARYTPQITDLIAIGISGKYQADKLTVIGEFDYLTGSDDIANTTHGPKQMWDINDGNISGFNAYTKATYAATDKLSFGAVAGMGSGDDDLTGGSGNVNKLRTSGFFYITEIWEDSIMPDEEGISPQGLGAPNVRGYRELENTTALQANATFKPIPKLSLFLSYTWLKATQPIHAWSVVTDIDGNAVDAAIDPDIYADDIGSEIDFNFKYVIQKPLVLGLRGGVFFPGDAAGYLINGQNNLDDPAWELKGYLVMKF